MRILWVKTELLHPVDKGGRIRTYQMLRALSRQHEVTYLCLDDGGAAPDARERASEYCSELVTVPFHPTEKKSPAYFIDLLANLLSPLPYAVARYRSASLMREVRRLAPRADLIICDFLFPSQSFPNGLGAPKILFQHNVEAKIWERHATIPQNPIRRIYMSEQWRRMRAFERAACRRFDRVIAVSAADAEQMSRDYGVSAVSSVETGVDVEYFAPIAGCVRSANELIFVGSMDWMPNEEGIRWFVEEVFSRIRAAIPDARLTIVGRLPSAALRQLAVRYPGIEVTGTVPDVRPYLARGTVSVVPLRVAGGTRLKIYEAMAMGIPLVSTTIGAEGLPVRHDEHLMIADTPEDQAKAIVGLLQDRGHADRLAATSQRFVREHCSWDAVTAQFLRECRKVQGEPLASSQKELVE